MKLIINSVIISGFIFLLYWNSSSENLPIVVSGKPPPRDLNYEEKLTQALEYKYPLYFLKWHLKLIKTKSSLVHISESPRVCRYEY